MATLLVAGACQTAGESNVSHGALVTPHEASAVAAESETNAGPELEAQGASEQAATASRPNVRPIAQNDADADDDALARLDVIADGGGGPAEAAAELESACSQRCVSMYDECSWRAQVACIDRCVMTSSASTAQWRSDATLHVAPVPWAMGDAHMFDVEMGELGNCDASARW